VEGLCGDLGLKKVSGGEVQRAEITALRPIAANAAPLRTSAAVSGERAVAPAPEILVLSETESAPRRKFYLGEMRPFLEQPKLHRRRLADAARTASVIAGLQTLLPVAAHGTLQDLSDICDEARQLLRQESLHRWLHGWLLLHIPLSLALIWLGAGHG
jgi:hypothetical protein